MTNFALYISLTLVFLSSITRELSNVKYTYIVAVVAIDVQLISSMFFSQCDRVNDDFVTNIDNGDGVTSPFVIKY